MNGPQKFSQILMVICLFIFFLSCRQKRLRTSTLVTKQTVRIDTFGIYDAPSVRTFPSSADSIQSWIDAMDTQSIRSHAWDIWESINSDTLEGTNFPIWETWYTGHELFEIGETAKTTRHGLRDFGAPLQSTHVAEIDKEILKKPVRGDIPIDPVERPTSFNRYSRSSAHAIWDKRLYSAKVLDSINNHHISQNSALEEREVLASKGTIDASGFVLKPLFQFISGTQPTALPYWAGISAVSTNCQERPGPETWKQCVIIDPTNSLEIGSRHKMMCNGNMGEWEVVDINRMYNIRFNNETAKNFSKWAEEQGGDDVGKGNMHDPKAIAAMIKPGNYALLMAMHVTGKEIANWTWQTFWWSPFKNQAPYGHDMPSSVKSPWNNYLMQTAYYMVTPPGNKNGLPNISFNPYLEANLEFNFKPPEQENVVVRGVFSNCMTCHRKAVYPFPKDNFYPMAGYIDKSDSTHFKGVIKTDFLWSLSLRAMPEKK